MAKKELKTNDLAKIGRPRKFTPETLAAKFEEYKAYHPTRRRYINEVIRSGERAGEIVQVPVQPPMSLISFVLFAGITFEGWDNYCKREEFVEVTTHIRKEIEGEQVDGAAVGQYNQNIIARLVGLADKVQMQGEGNAQLNISVNGKCINLKKE